MLGSLITFLVGVLVLLVVLYCAKLILDWAGLPDPIRQVAYLIVGLIALVALLALLSNTFALPGGPTWRW